jgi:hypothetical protein
MTCVSISADVRLAFGLRLRAILPERENCNRNGARCKVDRSYLRKTVNDCGGHGEHLAKGVRCRNGRGPQTRHRHHGGDPIRSEAGTVRRFIDGLSADPDMI